MYQDEHVEMLSKFIVEHSNSECEVIIVDPGRGRKNKLAKMLHKLGYESSFSKPENTAYLEDKFKGDILSFVRTH